nr:xylulose kinase-1 [Tanacetum cinerariifolium]
MQNFISSSDLLCWNIVLKGNSAKSMTTDKDGNLKIRPPVTAEEHQQVQREKKARTILLSTLPDEHMGDFYHMIDARDIWNAIKARFGGNAESKKMQKFATAVVSPHSKTEFAFMGLSSEVSIPVTCPLCCDSKYKLIEKDYQGQREQLNDCVVDLKAHKHAVKILEKQIKCQQKNQLAYEEKIRVLPYELEEKSNILEYRQKLIDQAAQEKQDLMTKLDIEIANQAKWNNSGRNLYKLIDNSMSVRTKRGLGLDKYIGEDELGINDSKFSIFHINTDDLERQPIYNRFASVDHMQAVPPLLKGNYMPPSNIPDIDESQIVDRSSNPSTNDFQTCDSSQECSRPNHSDHDSNDFISSISVPASESSDTIVTDCTRQEYFPSVCPSSIETDVKSSKTLLVKRHAKGKGILGRRPTGKTVNPNKPKPVSAGTPKPVFAVYAGDGLLGPRPLNIQPTSTYFHSFTHNNQQIIIPITHNSLYSLYMTGGLNGKTVVKPSAGWPWTKYGMLKTKGSKINGGSKSKSWSFGNGPLGRPKSEMTWVPKEN